MRAPSDGAAAHAQDTPAPALTSYFYIRRFVQGPMSMPSSAAFATPFPALPPTMSSSTTSMRPWCSSRCCSSALEELCPEPPPGRLCAGRGGELPSSTTGSSSARWSLSSSISFRAPRPRSWSMNGASFSGRGTGIGAGPLPCHGGAAAVGAGDHGQSPHRLG